MNTSTPMGSRRETRKTPSVDASPIEVEQNELVLGANEDSGEAVVNDLRTGLSDNTGQLELTPPTSETSSKAEKRLARGGKDLNKAAEFAGIIRRSRSLPDISCELQENTFYTFCKEVHGGAFKTFKAVRSRSAEQLMPEDEEFLKNHSLSPWASPGGRVIDIIRDKLEKVNINNGFENGEEDSTRHGVLTLGKNASKSLLNEVVTPGGMGEKRHLKFSPDTPVGNYDKVSIIESSSPENEGIKTGELLVAGKVVKRILRGRRLFQFSPRQMKTSPGVGERRKKKTPVLKTRKIKSKLASRMGIIPLGQPLITSALDKIKQKLEMSGRDLEEDCEWEKGMLPSGDVGLHEPGDVESELEGGEGITPYGRNDLHGSEEEEIGIVGRGSSAPNGDNAMPVSERGRNRGLVMEKRSSNLKEEETDDAIVMAGTNARPV